MMCLLFPYLMGCMLVCLLPMTGRNDVLVAVIGVMAFLICSVGLDAGDVTACMFTCGYGLHCWH